MQLQKIVTASAIFAFLHGAAFAARLEATAGKPFDMVYGKVSAPVTLTVDSSPTCPHCVEFEQKYLPRLMKDYVEPGKLQIEYRPFLRNSVDAIIFILAKEKGGRIDETVKQFMLRMDDLATADDVEAKLREIALQLDINAVQFDHAVADQQALDELNAQTDEATNVMGVSGPRPSF